MANRPFLLASPKLPLSKWATTCRMGQMCSGVLLVPASTRTVYEDVAGELERQQRRYFGRDLCSLRVVAALQDGGQLAYDMLQSMDDDPDTRECAVRLPKDRRLVLQYHRRNTLVSAYDGWVRQRPEEVEGNCAVMLGIMFNELRGGPAAVLDQMRQEIEAFYGRLLKRMHPRPGVAGA